MLINELNTAFTNFSSLTLYAPKKRRQLCSSITHS